jgi:hypothetical protein
MQYQKKYFDLEGYELYPFHKIGKNGLRRAPSETEAAVLLTI